MVFLKFTGSDAVKNRISCLLAEERLPHAIVLEGAPDDTLVLARDLAAALVCKGAGDVPCGTCPACKKAYLSSHPDIFEYVAKDVPKSFPVSVVRDVRADAYVIPNEADYKVYILGNASSMGREAQNALLKTLEEPPARVVIILTVSSKTLLLDTVLSRSVIFTLDESDKAYEDKIHSIVLAVAQSLAVGDEYGLMKAVAPLEGNRDGLRSLAGALTDFFRAALVYSAGGTGISSKNEAAEQLGCLLSHKQLLALLGSVAEIQNHLNTNANNTLVLTKLCYSLKIAVL